MGLRVVTPASTYPVTLAQAKAHCRVDGNDEDAYLDSLIAAATSHVESLIGRAVMAQTWEYLLDEFDDEMLIPLGPVSSVSSVKYFDVDAAEQTLAGTYYAVDLTSDPQRVLLADEAAWPGVNGGTNQVTIRFVAGYTTVPASIYHACLLLIGQWFDQRSGVSDKPISETPHAVRSLLSTYQSMVI